MTSFGACLQAPVIKKQLAFFLRIVLFYAIFFAAWRSAFLLANRSHGDPFSLPEALPAFLHGLRMDLSSISYILLFTVLLWLLSGIMTFSFFVKCHRLYHRAVIILLTLIAVGNIAIFHFWGTLLNYRALTYLTDPAEALVSLSFRQGLIAFAGVMAGIVGAIYLSGRIIRFDPPETNIPAKVKIATFITLMALLFLGIRGGWQMLPMNESLVYYSRNNVLNNAAVNPVWHLTYDVKTAGATSRNPFKTLDEEIAQNALNEWRTERSDRSPAILRSSRPNIVIIFLESYTSDIVSSMGGEQGVTPHFDSLISTGLLFDNVFSSGFRTDQGIVSVLNGWPATPFHSIIRNLDKCSRLPSLRQKLGTMGYRSSFYYGGESNFSNMNAYVLNQGFDRILDQDAFNASPVRGRWGVHDEVVLNGNLADLDTAQEPFFSVVVTLSNHEPFDVPGKPRFSGNDDASKFRNAAKYADEALGAYFKMARTKKWYDHTLFILVADHGHELPLHRNIIYPAGRHIPLLFTGGALIDSCRGQRVSKMGGHHDVPATLIAQLGTNAADFTWSKDLLDPAAPDFAYLPHENYLVWNKPEGWFIWQFAAAEVTERSEGYRIKKDDPEVIRARAMMQKHYSDYLNY